MHTFGILSSGAPLTFRRIQEAIATGELPHSQVGVVISDQPDVPILEAASELGTPYCHVKARGEAFDREALKLLLKYDVEIVLLIGFLPKVRRPLLDAFPDRILNIHSGPLPRFGGKGMIQERTQQAVLAAGAPYSGPTIHIVDEEYDHGQILAHWPVKVRPEDTAETLNKRCNSIGKELYVQVLRDLLHRLDQPEFY